MYTLDPAIRQDALRKASLGCATTRALLENLRVYEMGERTPPLVASTIPDGYVTMDVHHARMRKVAAVLAIAFFVVMGGLAYVS